MRTWKVRWKTPRRCRCCSTPSATTGCTCVLSRQVDGLRVEEPTLRWVAADELPSLGLPAPIRKLLDGATTRTPKRNSRNATTVSAMPRTVFCQYEQRDAEGLDFVPYPGELGQRIFNNIGKQAWAAWRTRPC